MLSFKQKKKEACNEVESMTSQVEAGILSMNWSITQFFQN